MATTDIRTSLVIDTLGIDEATVRIHGTHPITAVTFTSGRCDLTVQGFDASPREFAAALARLADRIVKMAAEFEASGEDVQS